MIVSRVTVVAQRPEGLEVEASGPSACARCAAGKGCGGGVFAALLGQGPRRVLVDDPLGVEPGETVLVGLRGGALVTALGEAAGWPLLGLFAGGALAGEAGGQGMVAIAAVAGLLAGVVLARSRLRRRAASLRPCVVARVAVTRGCRDDALD